MQMNPKQFDCLAKNVYHEARGESIEGQIAVAAVTLNRVEDVKYSNTICDVVYQDDQFSWTSKHVTIKDKEAWQTAKTAAALSVIGNVDPTNGATMFHSKKVKPYWQSKFKKTRTIGNHIFYKVK